MTDIITTQLNAQLRLNRHDHKGQLCLCRTCQAKLIAAFAVDLTNAVNGHQHDTLMTLAFTTQQSFIKNGVDIQTLFKTILCFQNPDIENMAVNVKITPLDEDDKRLFDMPPEGSA